MVAELEGVPEEDHPTFVEGFGKVTKELAHKPLEFLYEQFSAYVEDRRRQPRDDIMTKMATATFPDGTMPEVNDVALLAANLFTGGQETTVRLLSFALRILAERQDLQDRLRADRDLIPNFVEETLRYESPLRAQFRMAKVRTTVGGVDIPAGSTMLLLPGAANRDPRKFTDPGTFDLERENADLPPGLRARHPPLRRRPPRPGGGSGHHQPAPRPHLRASRSPRRPTARPATRPLGLPAHLLPARPPAPRPRAHSGVMTPHEFWPGITRPAMVIRVRTRQVLLVAEQQLELARRRAGGGAAVDREHDAGDLGGPVAGEEHGSLGDVRGLALPGERLREVPHPVHVVGGHGRADLTGDEAVHPDAVLRDVEGDRPGGVDHGGLGGPVGDEAGARRRSRRWTPC